MRRHLTVFIRWAVFVGCMMAVTGSVHAQLGGLIRRGIEKGIQRGVQRKVLNESSGGSGVSANSQPGEGSAGTTDDFSEDLFSSSRARRLLALIVSVGNPGDEKIADLKNVDEAGAGIHERLMNSGFSEKDRELVLLTTTAGLGDAVSTKEQIRKAAEKLVEKADKDDFLLMYFVGHGFSIEQAKGAPGDQRFRSYFVAGYPSKRDRGSDRSRSDRCFA